MPLADFAQKKNTGTTSQDFNPSSGGSLAQFANKKEPLGAPISSAVAQSTFGPGVSSLPRNVDEARKMQEEDPTLWQTIVKQLMKPIGTVATLAEQTGKAIGGEGFEAVKATPKKIGGIWSGTQQNSFTDVFRRNWDAVKIDGGKESQSTAVNFWNDGMPEVLGLITDIAADPLNYVGGGLTKSGQLTDKAMKLKAAGDTIKADSKLAYQLKAMGITDDMFELGATKAEQVEKGQRALLTAFANTRWEKTLYGGAPVYRLFDNIGTGLKQTKASQFISKVFSTKTSDEAFNVVKNHFDNLYDYRKGEVMTEALDLQKKIGALPADDAQRIIDVVETGTKTGVKSIDDIASQLDGNFKKIRKTEEGLGLLKTDIEQYFPHQLVKKNAPLIKTEREIVANTFDDFIDQVATYNKAAGDKLKAVDISNTNTFDELSKMYKSALTKEELTPEVVRSIDNWTVTGKQLRDFYKEEAAAKTGWQKFKTLFQNADGINVDDEVKPFSSSARKYSTKLDAALKRNYKGTISEIKKNFGIEFDDRPAIAYAKRALGSAKATTSKEFFDSVKSFAFKAGDEGIGVETKVKELKGLKFAPDIARQIDEYANAIRPEELNKALKVFDSVQNWWKAQALVAPSYHTRNFAGNMWNNFLGGVIDPKDYIDAGKVQHGNIINFTDDAGRQWNNKTILDAAKRSGVINEGWYARDIDIALADELGGASWNPFKQNFGLFKLNRKAGTVLENNSRLAHFISKIKQGNSIDEAAISVKKFLFDYGDLTGTEKQVFKRLMPFYTWTRKNIPLQLEQLVKQPGKFAAIPKVTGAVESQVEKPNEKYLGDYIKNNAGIRVGTDSEGNTMYFLMGGWLPAASAIDFLSQPTENFVMSLTPFAKTPIELWANQSTFFEDTFGQPSKIERYPEENQSWLGLTMRKKTAYVLKNIRILNELDKLNPGSVFGDEDSPSLINRIAPEAGFRAPFGIGNVTTSEKRGGKFTPEGTTTDRILQSMFGKTSLYNPNFAKKFYLWDTETKIRELERAAKDAARDGQKEYSKRLRKEIAEVKKSRK